MRAVRNILFTGFILFLGAAVGNAQDCADYHMVGDCMLERQSGYKIYSQSRSADMAPGDSLELNIVFYGQNEYILSFCARQEMYQVHFVLVDPDTGSILYDNSNDGYIGSLGLGFNLTKSLAVIVDVLPHGASGDETGDLSACVGLLIQYKNYDNKNLDLKTQ